MSFGEFAIGEAAISETALSASKIVTFYYSDRGYDSTSGDTPDQRHFNARLLQPFSYSRSLMGVDELFGIARQSIGDIIFDNADGHFDSLARNYTIDGREIRVKLGDSTLSYVDFRDVFTGTADGWEVDEDRLTISLRDKTFKLDQVLQSNFYAGTGGTEGGDDLKGKPKPLCHGKVFDITPTFLGIIDTGDGALYTYQVHDGTIQGVTDVYEGGLAYTEVTTGAPTTGEWKQNTSTGIFQIGSTPSLPVTCDLEGDNSGTGYVNQTGSVLLRFLQDYAPALASSDLDTSAIQALDVDAPGEIGIYLDSNTRSAEDVIEEVLRHCAAFGGFNRNGKFTAKLLQAPTNDISKVAATFREQDFKSRPRRLGSSELPENIRLPNWRRSVGFKRNWTVLNQDLDTAISSSRLEFLRADYRESPREDADVQTRNLNALNPPRLGSFYTGSTPAASVQTRLMNLFSGTFEFFEVVVRANWTLIDIGDTVRVFYPRFGLTNGAKFLVVDYAIDAVRNETRFILFKP